MKKELERDKNHLYFWKKQKKQKDKDEELYKAALQAFFKNELENDKTILNLSIAAIGFFMALFVNKKFQITEIMFITSTIAVCSFLISSGIILLIFKRNKKQVLEIIKTTGKAAEDPILVLLDRWKYLPFIVGVISSVIFSLSLTFTNLTTKEVSMSGNQKKIESESKVKSVNKGFSGISNANMNYQKDKAGFSGVSDSNQSGSKNDSKTNNNFTDDKK